jgi:hypothetical protein
MSPWNTTRVLLLSKEEGVSGSEKGRSLPEGGHSVRPLYAGDKALTAVQLAKHFGAAVTGVCSAANAQSVH